MPKIDLLKDHSLSFLDVETTGLDPYSGDRICEAAIIKYRNGKILESFQSLIDPERPISSGAAAVNGITSRMVKGKPLFKKVAPRILLLIKDTVLVCHNAPFDLGFLAAECQMAGFAFPKCPVIDTLAIARQCFSFYSNSLGSVAASLGIEIKNAHRAMADVQTTMEILAKFSVTLKARGIESLDELLSIRSAPRGRRRNSPSVPPHLKEAVENKKPIKIKYVSGMGEYTVRVVEPIEIVLDNGCLYLVAYCRLRKAERSFRLDRIVKINQINQID